MHQAFIDNADFYFTNNVAKGKLLHAAITEALLTFPEFVSKSREQQLRYDKETLLRMRKEIQDQVQRLIQKDAGRGGMRLHQSQFERSSGRF